MSNPEGYGRASALDFRGVFGLIFLIPVTVMTRVGDPTHVAPLFKNVALLSGLIHFGIRGGGAFSIDR